MAVLDAGFAIDIRHLLQPAKGQCRGEWRNNQIAPEPPRQFDRWPRERRNIGGDRPLHGFRCDRHIVELIVLAVMRDWLLALPQPAHDPHAFFEDRLIVLEGDMERGVFAPVITAPGGEIDASA